MKQIIMLFLFVSIFIMLSCRKDVVTKYVDIHHSWRLDSALYGNNKILLNSVQLNDSILAVATSYTVIYTNANQLKGSYSIPIPGHDLYSSGLVRPSLSKSVSAARVDKNNLALFKTFMPAYMDGISKYFSPSYSSSDQSLKELPSASIFNSGYSIIKSKYILAPYEVDFLSKKATFSLITVDSSQYCNITQTKDVVIDEPIYPGFYAGSYRSWAFDDKFFVTLYGQSYRIDTLGNYKNLLKDASVFNGKYIDQMFELNNHLFAIGWGTMFVSNDKGETWQTFVDLSGTEWGNLQYFNVGNEVYAVYLSQIARVTLKGSTLSIQELDNDGLEGNQITSICKCGKYAFITTLSGLFYRDVLTFNTPKKTP